MELALQCVSAFVVQQNSSRVVEPLVVVETSCGVLPVVTVACYPLLFFVSLL